MDSGKTISLLLIVIALAGIYLHSGNQLTPLLQNLKNANGTSIAQLAIAIIVFIVVLSLLPDNYAVPITAVVILGALLVNHEKQGNNDLVNELDNLIKGNKA